VNSPVEDWLVELKIGNEKMQRILIGFKGIAAFGKQTPFFLAGKEVLL